MTLHYYQNHAQDFFDGTVNVDMTPLYEAFTQHLPHGARVLDAGCGSGRDAKAFHEMGYQVDAFDASSAMVELARQHTGLPVQLMTFSEVDVKAQYDGIWCCASLLHVPSSELPAVMQKLADALKPGGVWYVSFKYGNGERVQGERRFTDLNEMELRRLLNRMSEIDIFSLWITKDNRPDRDEIWFNGILKKKIERQETLS
ncbi:class I SAM-dependent methyltransferase [Enterobacter bugandensis]|uniref:class I SAM-dependent methyltransferase n=1 Tax=Enterobacter bugandensis TaxID=881260 RepID=UPI002005EFAD|nr:class I SAM-dependent methyltransferase [Enterobacter bugandensis]MCK7196705.1 class I SAM-dependent methyltransferase [Enterobacter bugandensis]HCM9595534.1 class I SAM-dependent methyltransferase [Enterobacter bugandensis]HCM9598336.1 class I SAM-dependent methyltransferase [Enterobacter bugandensis]